MSVSFSNYRHTRQVIEELRNGYNLNRSYMRPDGLPLYEFATRSLKEQDLNRASL